MAIVDLIMVQGMKYPALILLLIIDRPQIAIQLLTLRGIEYYYYYYYVHAWVKT